MAQTYNKQGNEEKLLYHSLKAASASIDSYSTTIIPIVRHGAKYPIQAQTRNIAGHVLFRFTVDAKGHVQNPVVVEHLGHEKFISNSLKALKKFRYIPGTKGGKPTKTEGVEYKFSFNIAS